MRQKDPTSGYVSAATGSLFGYTVAGLAGAFLLGPPLGASPWLIITFDQDGVLELAGVTVVFALAIAIFVGAPLGCWLWLRRGRHRRAGITAGLVVPLLLALGWVAAAVVPAAPDDPVLLPFSSLLAAFVAGLLARALALLGGVRGGRTRV